MSVLFKAINYIKRPFVGSQTTARLALQQSLGYTKSGIYGGAGQHVMRNMLATQPNVTIASQSYKLNDPTVTGNVSGVLHVTPLSEQQTRFL